VLVRAVFHRMSADKVTLDLNDIASGRIELSNFESKLSSLDLSPYKGKHVQMTGCAPTWAHLLVAGRLFPVVSALDFIIDDGKEGKIVELLKP